MLIMRRRSLRRGAALWLLVMTGLIAGCAKPVATVNGRPVDRRTFDVLLKERTDALKQQAPAADLKKLRESVLNDLITEGLMLDEAGKRGISVSDAEVKKEVDGIRSTTGEDDFNRALRDKGMALDLFLRRTREKMLMSRFMESLLAREVVTEEEIRQYYRSSPRPFLKPAKVLMNMIEFDSEEEARKVIREMREKKSDFDAVAKELEAGKKAAVSGYGWVNPDLFSPGLSLSIRNLRNGQYGGPYQGKQKVYLVRVMDREKEGIASYNDMRESIRNTLLEQKRQVAFAHWLDRKRRESKIEISLQ